MLACLPLPTIILTAWEPLNSNRHGVFPDQRQLALVLVLHKRVFAPSLMREVTQIANRAVSNLAQRFLREEGLVAAHQHVMKGSQTHELVVVDDMTRMVVVEECALAFVHVQC
ncbi:hypothetical protein F5Y06DRAFT_73372 [Hypoxylon sp. FL0890]|nr:hypothetical protein F5Y06DRAFT_73372 [Hypoxylon sp. FL0890]